MNRFLFRMVASLVVIAGGTAVWADDALRAPAHPIKLRIDVDSLRETPMVIIPWDGGNEPRSSTGQGANFASKTRMSVAGVAFALGSLLGGAWLIRRSPIHKKLIAVLAALGVSLGAAAVTVANVPAPALQSGIGLESDAQVEFVSDGDAVRIILDRKSAEELFTRIDRNRSRVPRPQSSAIVPPLAAPQFNILIEVDPKLRSPWVFVPMKVVNSAAAGLSADDKNSASKMHLSVAGLALAVGGLLAGTWLIRRSNLSNKLMAMLAAIVISLGAAAMITADNSAPFRTTKTLETSMHVEVRSGDLLHVVLDRESANRFLWGLAGRGFPGSRPILYRSNGEIVRP